MQKKYGAHYVYGKKFRGFSLMELLTALAIVGLIAAFTIPSIVANMHERMWSSQRKSLFARLSQAVAILPKLNGYGDSSDYENTATEDFVSTGLNKVYKIEKKCTKDDGDDYIARCGFSDLYYTADGLYQNSFPKTLDDLNLGNAVDMYDTNTVALITLNGESMLVAYNPDCQEYISGAAYDYAQNAVCVNFIYDLNNSKGPNKVGHDIGFITAMYATDSVVVAPLPYREDLPAAYSFDSAPGACKKVNNLLRVPDINELGALWFNKSLTNMDDNERWSSSIYSAGSTGYGWSQTGSGKRAHDISRNASNTIRCVYK